MQILCLCSLYLCPPNHLCVMWRARDPMWLCCLSYKVVCLWPNSLVCPPDVPTLENELGSMRAGWNSRPFPVPSRGYSLPSFPFRRTASLAKWSDPVLRSHTFLWWWGGSLVISLVLHPASLLNPAVRWSWANSPYVYMVPSYQVERKLLHRFLWVYVPYVSDAHI